MKLVLVLFCLVTSFAHANEVDSKKMKSCLEHYPDIRACIEIVPLTKKHYCPVESQIKSGTRWVDELQLDAMSEMYTNIKEFCELLSDEAEFGPNNEELTFCCGG